MRRRASMALRSRTWLAAAAAALAVVLSGCGLGGGLYDTPLPGGADVGDDPITITADFHDVVDLVPQSSVKVENIAVGRVSEIELNDDGRSARVTLVIRGDLDLPQGTTARLQQTSLLGEKYVALIRPDGDTSGDAATGTATGTATGGADDVGVLGDGATIGLADTSQVAEVEQVLGAMSLVINGGGIGKFQEISRELQQVSEGRPEQIRSFLRTMEVFVGGLDSRKTAITDALDALNELSASLENDKDKIATALEDLSPGMQVLVDQRSELVDMLDALDRLSEVTVRTLNASQQNMVEDLKLLEPILGKLAESGEALPDSLELLLTYPFPDSVLNTIRGDYLNVFVTTNYSTLPKGCKAMGCPWPQHPDTGAAPAIDPLDPGDGGAQRRGAPDADPSGSPEPSDTPGAGTSEDPEDPESPEDTPSPTLLPPTDSPLPGIPEPTIEVPAPSSGSSTTPRSPGSTPAEEN